MGQYACILALVLLLMGAPAWGASYFVSTSGNDSNNGSAGSPWRTIQHAANTAVAGDTVTVAAGTYTERVTFPTSGTSGNRIVFQGTMSGSTPTTVIDGSSPTSGWVGVGNGVFRAGLGSPASLTATYGGGQRSIWRIDNSFMNIVNGHSTLHLSANAITNVSVTNGVPPHCATSTSCQVNVWDGIEALFGNSADGQTWLRFRNGTNPSSLDVRMAPAGGVLRLSSSSFITIRQFAIRGGEIGIEQTGTSQGNLIELNDIRHGKNQIALHAGGGSNTTIQQNVITPDSIGLVQWKPGERTGRTYERALSRLMYDRDKFLIGTTEIRHAAIMIAGGATGTLVRNNTISRGIAGFVFYNNTSNTTIEGNVCRDFADICIYMNADLTTNLRVTNNLFLDSMHHLRLESMSRAHTIYIYMNRFHNPWYNSSGGGGKSVFIPPHSGPFSPTTVWVYHNSFAGGGWSVDLGGTSEGTFSFPTLFVKNNIMSNNGFSSGGVNPIPAANRTNNLQTNTWFSNTIPSFIPPGGHAAINGCPSLSSAGLPGITAGYYVDGNPDCGVAQAGQLPAGGADDPPPPDPVVQRPRRTLITGGW